MNIVMMTNTYLPHVGGVARSVASFATALRAKGHRVLVVAPTFENMPTEEEDVIRVAAIQRFNGSDFSVRLPVIGLLASALDEFRPQVIHSHHPFLLGDTALRIAAMRNLPLVFTHHTMYESYTHYVPGNSTTMQRFAVRLASEYANLCDHVIAPSESVAGVLRERGVSTPIVCIPTGIDPAHFACGDGAAARARFGIASEAFVVGHVGRLAPEKNLGFLARALARFAAGNSRAHALIVGSGPAREEIQRAFEAHGVGDRLHLPGPLQGQALADAYHAMNVFAFASQSETQGMVLAEAATAGLPLVALDAPGAREVVRDGVNGRLLAGDAGEEAFASVLGELARAGEATRGRMIEAARATAEEFSLARTAGQLAALYAEMVAAGPPRARSEDNGWTQTLRLLEAEWALWSRRTDAAIRTVREA